MSLLLSLAAVLLTLRPDAPSLTLEEARAAPASVLADRLLQPGHPVITEVYIHPNGMDAPLPWVTGVDFVEEARLEDGLCRATVVRVGFKPTHPQNLRAPAPSPARAEDLSSQTFGRLPASDAPAASCRLPLTRYFPLDPTREAEQLALIHRLKVLMADAAAGRPLPPTATFHDQLADVFPKLQRIPDVRAALQAFPIQELNNVWMNHASPDLRGELEATSASWAAQVTVRDGLVVQLDLVRRIPPPF